MPTLNGKLLSFGQGPSSPSFYYRSVHFDLGEEEEEKKEKKEKKTQRIIAEPFL